MDARSCGSNSTLGTQAILIQQQHKSGFVSLYLSMYMYGKTYVNYESYLYRLSTFM